MELTIEQALQRGVAAHKKGKLQDAEKLYRAILQSQPAHPDANHNLGILAVSANKTEAALPHFESALSANPKIEQFWLSYIDALIRTEKLDDARQVLVDAQKAGVTSAKLQGFDEQLKSMLPFSCSITRQEISNPPHSHADELLRAIELRDAGKYTEALDWLGTVIERDNKNPEALSLLSQILLLDQKEVEAERTLIAAASINSELPSVYRNQARLLLKKSKPQEALEKAQLGCRQSPEDSESLLVLAACLIANQRDSEALPIIDGILTNEPNNAEAYANRVLIKLRLKEMARATEDAKMAVSLKPHLTQMWWLLSNLHYQANNLSDAIEALKSAHKNESENTAFMKQLGEYLRKDNKVREAINILEKATEIDPDDADAWTNLGVAYQQGKMIPNAKRAYYKALALNPESVVITSNLGAMAKQAKEWDSALQYFEKALRINPNFAEVHFNLGFTLQELARLDEAEASYRHAIAVKPDFAQAFDALGSTIKDLGRLDEAEACYTKATELKPDFVEAHFNLGVTLQQRGRLDGAVASFERVIKLRPDYHEAHCKLLKCFYESDNQSLFFDKLDYVIDENLVNPTIGSLTRRSALKYGLEKPNLFCGEPLDYVSHIDLSVQCDFKKIFAENVKSLLADHRMSSRKQNLLSNGYQTSGNIFDIGNESIEGIEKTIRQEIEKYRSYYKNSEEGFIKEWPTEYILFGWLISMQSGGELKPHIHENGWLSGSVYINVPPKLEADSGNIVVALGQDSDAATPYINEKKIINVLTGSAVLFPASLMHHTIPFESNEERIVLAFDVRKNSH